MACSGKLCHLGLICDRERQGHVENPYYATPPHQDETTTVTQQFFYDVVLGGGTIYLSELDTEPKDILLLGGAGHLLASVHTFSHHLEV
jgi:hypothetical protein